MNKYKENNTNFVEHTLTIHKSSQPNCLQPRLKKKNRKKKNPKLKMNNVYHALVVYDDLVSYQNQDRNELVTFGRKKERKLKSFQAAAGLSQCYNTDKS